MVYKITSKVLVVLMVYFNWNMAMAQNMVKNPSFEDCSRCPETYGSLEEEVLFWTTPTEGSSDYFNACSPEMSTGQNFIGEQPAYDGAAYVGMYAYAPKDYREYLTSELGQTLVKGKKYNFSFMVNLADKSEFGVNGFGILFTRKPLDLHIKRNIPINLMRRKGYENYIEIRNHNYFADKENWVKISGNYTADGTENYMTIGNFKDNLHTTKIKKGRNLKKVAYYYIDMVSLTMESESYKLDEIYVLENLIFEVDGDAIKGEGKKQLESLVRYLKTNPSFNIAIYGHTDNLGSKKYNKELSKRRAKAVARFLVDKGLTSSRIAWRGFGDINPMAENETEKGRELNRRVEFVVSKRKREYYASGLFEDEDEN